MDLYNYDWDNYQYWSLTRYAPRPEQRKIIDEIQEAMELGFRNIILEAGTGIGKSAIATTIAKMVEDSYILTMTNQLQSQYLQDFKHMVKEIKGRNNYLCNFNHENKNYTRMCDECLVDEINDGEHDYQTKYNVVQHQSSFEIYDFIPDEYHEDIIENLDLKKCFNCEYLKAFKKALNSNCVITNYDFLFYAGHYAKLLPPRELLILDESHNFEKKIMSLITKTLNRKSIMRKSGYDIFWGIENGKTLKEVQSPQYWITVCNVLLNYSKDDLTKEKNKKYAEKELKSNKNNNTEVKNKKIKSLEQQIKKYEELIKTLETEKWIIETPTKKEIISDTDYKAGLKVEFKPLTIADYSEQLLQFGETRLFLTGTLGNKDKFCKWIGIDPDETYYIYVKSPFPVEHRPIRKAYVGKMSGFNSNRKPNWQNNKALNRINEILKQHQGEKGVIHTSSNAQAWWIKKSLDNRLMRVAQGSTREETIKKFENSNQPLILIGAGLKDGVDFKGDKCRYQILFKMPFPSLASAQVNIRKHYDKTWYAYQTIMPLMQAYGRGIRDMDDYCVMYVLDSDFDSLLSNYKYLFNEYFLEAIVKPKRPVRKNIKMEGK